MLNKSLKGKQRQEKGILTAYLTIAFLTIFWMCSFQASAQTTASLSGTVTDPTGAVIPGAQITITNFATHDVRKTISNSSGFFSLPALGAATYTVVIEAHGFERWRISNLELHPGDNKSLASIVLQIGKPEVTVEVDANTGGLIQNSGELGSVISADDMKRLATEGRSATELIKMMPGMAVTGNQANTGYDPTLSGIANSSVSNFSANGNPIGSINETLNGANVIDPGNMGGAEATMNMDMIQEVNVQTADFGADSARGPVVINAVSKSGGSQFHGGAYLYARYFTLNSIDRQLKSVDGDKAQKPQDKYYYPGGNIGGPVKIPGTSFNSNGKLRFFVGYEYYSQVFPGPLLSTVVPSDDMRNGDFSAASLSKLCSSAFNVDYSAANGQPSGGPLYCVVPNYMPDGTPISNGQLTSNMIDPGGASIYNLFPHANAVPTAANGGANYIYQVIQNQNGWQLHGRLDYNWNDSNKLYMSYNRQAEDNQMPVNLYWIPPNSVPYPGNIVASSTAHSVSLNYTRIFSPSLTNEAIGTFTYYNAPYALTNEGAVSRSGMGFPYGTVFKTGAKVMPSVVDWVGGGYPQMLMPGGFDQGPVFARKPDYTLQDNVTKILGPHSTKSGFFYELQENNQVSSALTQGQYQFYPWAYEYGSLGAKNGWGGCNNSLATPVCFNPDADILMGAPDGYTEQNKIAHSRIQYKTVAIYGQDEWKATKRLTLTGGIRLEHLGPWTDTEGIGMAVWEPQKYAAEVGTRQTPGVYWHAIDKSLPLSGVTGIPAFYVNPRVGMALDVYGNGHTVLRGGWGAYHFQEWPAAAGGALTTAQQVTSVTVSQAFNMKDVTSFTGSNGLQSGTTVSAMNLHDNKRATTYDYNLTVTQQLPWSSVFQIGYVGTDTVNQLIPGINGNTAENINAMPRGTLFKAYCDKDYPQLSGPNCQDVMSNGSVSGYGSLTATQIDALRPYGFYHQINYVTHGAKSNYNALQVTWNRQKGAFIWGANYTWSKALGVMGYEPDQTNYKNNYGPLSTDRSQIFNITYSWAEGRLFHGNRLVGGVLNGWEVSGISGFQSGPNLQAIYNTNFGFSGSVPSIYPNGGKPLGNTELLGTPDINLQPLLTCNPGAGLHSSGNNHRFINTSCFAVPDTTASTIQNGPFWWPYLHGPAYMSNDLSVYKNLFQGESKSRSLQLRLSAFNFLNHALVAFNPSNTNYSLNMALNSTGNGSNFSNFLQYPTFGATNYSSGRRIVELGAKYSF